MVELQSGSAKHPFPEVRNFYFFYFYERTDFGEELALLLPNGLNSISLP